MNTQMRRFADEYVTDRNGTAAAIRAGYSEKRARQTAYDLLKRPDVAQYIATKGAEVADSLGISAEWIAERLKHEAEFAPPASRIRALEALAKLTGQYVQRSEHREMQEVTFTYRLED